MLFRSCISQSVVCAAAGTYSASTGNVAPLQQWWQFACTINQTATTVFFNGTRKAQTNYSGPINLIGEGKVELGRQPSANNQPTNARFSNFLVMCNYTLDDDEVNYLWQNPLTFTPVTVSDPIYVVNGSVNFTSDGGQMCGFDGSSYTLCGPTEDATPTFTFQTQDQSTCKLWHEPLNYTSLNSSGVPDCQDTDDTTHTCSLTDVLDEGIYPLYVSCISGASEMNNFSKSPANIINISVGKTTVYEMIETGINNSLGVGATTFRNQKVYVRDDSNNQAYQTFDVLASYGSQRWAFNYLTYGESGIPFYNVSPGFYFLYLANATALEASDQVSAFINATQQ